MAIVNLDKVLSGVNGNLESVIVYDKDKKQVADYANGLIVKLEAYIEAFDTEVAITRVGEVHGATLSADGTGDVLLAHAPELSYDEKVRLRDFKNEAGKVIRGYRLAQGDILSVTDHALGLANHADLKVGDTVIVTDGKLVKGTAVESALTFAVTADAGYEVDSVEQAWVLQVQ